MPGSATTYRRVYDVTVLIDRILPRPEAHAFHNREHTRLLPRRGPALELLGLHELALDAEDRLFNSAGLDVLARRRSQTRQRPLRDSVRRIDRRRVRGFQEMLRDDVDDALARVHEVLQTVLRFIEAPCIANDEDWWVVVDLSLIHI